MCECGCVSSDRHFRFPASGDSFYILTLQGACVDCDGAPSIRIELVEPSNTLYEEYVRGDFLDGDLAFEECPDSKAVSIVCGMRRHEFVKAMMAHLVGVDSSELGEDGTIDEAGAEVILEEMYEDSQTQPRVLVAKP